MKEYLGQIRVIDKEVYFKLKEREEFKRSRKSIQAVDYSKDLIQSTPENKIENGIPIPQRPHSSLKFPG